MMTKDQVSDLRSYHSRVVQCELAHEKTQQDLDSAKQKLEGFLWKMEHEKP